MHPGSDVQLTEALTEARDRIVRSPLSLSLHPSSLRFHARACLRACMRARIQAHVLRGGGCVHGSIRANARTRKLLE